MDRRETMPSRRTFLLQLAAAPLCLRSLAAASLPATNLDPAGADLAQAFASPPEAARPYVLWMWMGCNISKQGITHDLEAMKETGIGGATLFSLADTLIPWAGVIGKSPTPEIVTWTEPWWAMVHHAASECRRLGLELILHNCAGYPQSCYKFDELPLRPNNEKPCCRQAEASGKLIPLRCRHLICSLVP